MGNMECEDGQNAKYFYIWCALRIKMGEPVIVHENVTKFGLAPLLQCLGTHYLFIRLTIEPPALGWATSRMRQIVVGLSFKFLAEI